MNKLKPCPFCGEEADIETMYMGLTLAFRVYCKNIYHCSVKQINWNTEKDAIKAWNKRVDEQE